MKALLFIIFSLIVGVTSAMTDSIDSLKPLSTENPPVIDGDLNDEVWTNAPFVTDFKTFRPDFGLEMEHKTVVYMAYDEENIYFAFKCYDVPNLIKTSVAARDQIEADDWIRVNMDSFNDRQSLYSFYVNPNGIQMDTRSDGRRDDPGIDFVWYSAGKIDEEGYTVEMQIPFKSIRYANKGDVVTMGMVFGRRISRLSVEGSYPELDPNLGDNFMIQTIPIEYKGIKKNTLLEVLPAFTRSKRYADNLGTLTPEKGISELGVTGKWGITSELVLDATYNPDFSQVEADVQQIDDNQRFALFYPERRPFFQEGSENFNIAGRAFTEGIQNVVNTRSVVNPIFATKLSGRLGAKNRIAAIYAKDEFLPDTEKPDSIDFADVYVLRYKRALNSDSYLGASFTNRYQEGKYNIVYGADGQYRLGKNSVLSSHFYKLSDNDTSNDVSMNE
ncbi:MAG: carbohydrate binding family 9 domain-containing protein, partial [Cyclobacteriaceae bacterium]|nr:carbohydrate binding family 9 domain-containing protein [Cyclobacteriaceae bacterium]